MSEDLFSEKRDNRGFMPSRVCQVKSGNLVGCSVAPKQSCKNVESHLPNYCCLGRATKPQTRH